MDKNIELFIAKLLTSFLFVPIIGYFMLKVFEINKKKRRNSLENYLEKKESLEKHNSNNNSEFTSKLEEKLLPYIVNTIVDSKLSNRFAFGLITLIPSILVSYIGSFHFPILGFVFPLNMVVIVVLYIRNTKTKKNEYEYLAIDKHEIRVLDDNKTEILNLIPADIIRLVLYEVVTHHKGIPRSSGTIIELEINYKNQYHVTAIKMDQYWAKTKKNLDKKTKKTVLTWYREHSLIRKEIIDFCVRNGIKVKNLI